MVTLPSLCCSVNTAIRGPRRAGPCHPWLLRDPQPPGRERYGDTVASWGSVWRGGTVTAATFAIDSVPASRYPYVWM